MKLYLSDVGVVLKPCLVFWFSHLMSFIEIMFGFEQGNIVIVQELFKKKFVSACY